MLRAHSFARTLRAIAVVGVAVALTACAAAPTAGAPANSASTGGTRAPSGTRSAQGLPGVTGEVQTVNGSTFTVADPQQSGPYTTVELTGSTQILKQGTGTLASVPVGASINAVGSEDGGVFSATQVRVLGQTGQGGNRPGGPQASGTPRTGGPPASGTPRADGNGGQRFGGGGQGAQGGQGNAAGAGLFGTVEQATADSLTVRIPDGTSTLVRLAPNGQVAVEESGTSADIKPGVRVLVVGDEKGGKVSATRVQILPAAQ